MQEQFENNCLSEKERQQIGRSLESILATDKFLAAPQMSAFLRYVVEEAAAGNQSRIKAFTVAVDALGKPDTFDPQNDPVVRVLAGRLRAALDAYHEEHITASPIIKINRGSYVPSFVQNESDSSEGDVSEKNAVTLNMPSLSASLNQNDQDTENQLHSNPSSFTAVDELPINKTDPGDSPTHFATSSHPENKIESTKLSPRTDNAAHPVKAFPVKHPAIFSAGGIALAILVFSVLNNRTETKVQPDVLAALPLSVEQQNASIRVRPSEVSVFVSAINNGNTMENNLNTVISGAISESENIRVFRILQEKHITKFWPEDYILSVSSLQLPTETRVDFQLMDAQTGRISHSRSLNLAADARDGLSQKDLSAIINTARNLVTPDGPLFKDYATKLK